MSAQLVGRRFPTAERLGRGGQARGHAKHVQQAIRIVSEQMPTIDVHRIERGPRSQPDLRQLERTRDDSLYLLLSEQTVRPIRERTRSQQRALQKDSSIQELSHDSASDLVRR